LIGFTFSFCVIFPSASMFANPLIGFISVLVMMVGELDVSLLINDPDGKDPPFLLEFSAQIVFTLFLAFISVILMNLLVGIAVDDIQELKKKANVSKLVRQTKLISYIESALFNAWLPKWLRRLLFNTALVSPKNSHIVLRVRPLNASENRLPHDIMMEAFEVAKKRQHYQRSVSGTTIAEKRAMVDDDSAIANDGYDGESLNVNSWQVKLDVTTDKIDRLTSDMKDVKAVMYKNNQSIQELVAFIKAQKHEKPKAKEFHKRLSLRKV
jgi:Ion transport protein